VDHYQDLGLVFPGGNAPNFAVHASRSGARCAFLGVVGDDQAGALLRAGLIAEGVDVARLRTVPGPTPVVTVRDENDAGFDCVACPRSFLRFEPSTADADYLAGFDLVHLASTSRSDPSAPLWAQRVPLSYDFSDGPRPDDPLVALTTYAAVSRPGMGEAEAADLAVSLQRRGPRLAAVTRGAAGVTACLGGELCHQAAAAGSTIDTLGAGDALLAHLVVRLLSGEDLAAALGAAAHYAARTCGHLGAFGRGRSAAGVIATP
jgi:fructoselysine 6-kinase